MKRIIALFIAGCLAWVPVDAMAAVTWVGGAPIGKTQGSTTSYSLQTTVDVPIGSIVDVGYVTRSNSVAMTSVSDGLGNTYALTAIPAYGGVGRNGHAWSLTTVFIPANTTLTFTFTSATSTAVCVNAFTAPAGFVASPLDLNFSVSNLNSPTITVGPTASLAQLDELAITDIGAASNMTYTEGSSNTAACTNSTTAFQHVAFIETAATTALTYSGTASATAGYGGATISFKVASGTPVGTRRSLTGAGQ